MKKAVAVSLLTVLFLCFCRAGHCAENNWRFRISADDGTGSNGSQAFFGIGPTSKDPLPSDVAPLSDSQDSVWRAIQPTTSTVAGVFDNKAWKMDIKSPLPPWNDAYYDPAYPPGYHRKVWDLRVAGCGAATGNTTRLQFYTVSPGLMPTTTLTHPTLGAVKQLWWLKMVNNRGVEGAPANGTTWAIPIPTAHVPYTYDPFFVLTVPMLNISINQNEQALIDEGYVMEFFQTAAVPEPSSILALAGGLLGLAGFAHRRRR